MLRSKTYGILAAATLAAGTVLYSAVLAPRWLQTVHLRISVPNLPTEWEGLRIAHLSDFHLRGSGVSAELVDRAKHIATSFQPEVIALTGDYVDSRFTSAAYRAFMDWQDDIPIVAVLGNHDFERGPAHLQLTISSLEHGGVRVLRNEAIPVDLRGKTAWIVGVDDPFTLHADEAKAFTDLPATERALLFLAHSPSIVQSAPVQRTALILTGHTHGGQIRLLPSGRIPLVRLLRWILREEGPRHDPPIFRGCRAIDYSILVISHGIGMSQIPIRFRTRPEVLLIELTSTHTPGCGRSLELVPHVRVLNPPHRLVRWLS